MTRRGDGEGKKDNHLNRNIKPSAMFNSNLPRSTDDNSIPPMILPPSVDVKDVQI